LVVALWMQAVELQWRPQVRFFDLRTRVLLELEEEDLMDAFSWEANEVLVRVSPYEAYRVAVNGATCWITSPRLTPVNVRASLARFLDEMQPGAIHVSRAFFRYLLPIADHSATEAQGQFAGDVTGGVLPDGTALDAAVLLDGRTDSLGAFFQVEYGIVSESEVSLRLRGAGAIPPMQSPLAPDLTDAPACALWLSWMWTRPEDGRAGSRQDAEELWDRLVNESEGLSSRIGQDHRLDITEGGRERA
jgi:hypothetical protein